MPSAASTPYLSPISPTGLSGNITNHILPFKFLQMYIINEEIGSGGFGSVYAVTRRCDGLEVACKFIDKSKIARSSWYNDKELGKIPIEVAVLKNAPHENIIEFVDYMEDWKYCYCFTKLHGTGWSHEENPGRRPAMDLFECIEKNESFTEPIARHIFSQIVAAIAHLNSYGLVHRDIKDENILIDDEFNIKVIDFGSAAFIDPRGFTMFLGTKQYAAPEILARKVYHGLQADIWALGCCLYIILNGNVPFSYPDQAMQSEFTRPVRNLSNSCMDLLHRMLEKDPTKRATLKEVMNHPWLTMNHLPVAQF